MASLSQNLPPIKHDFADVPFEKQAQELVAIIKQHRFDEAESILDRHIRERTSSRGGNLYPASVINSIFSNDDIEIIRDAEFMHAVERWIHDSPSSSLAHLFRSKIFYQLAWNAREHQASSESSEKENKRFLAALKVSASSLYQAYNIEPDNPLILLDLLQLGRNFKVPHEAFDSVFNQLTENYPFLTRAYVEKALYLAPQWNGSREELLKFVRESMEKAPRSSNMPMVVIEAHNALAEVSNTKYTQRNDVWADIEYSYTRLMHDFPEAGLYPAYLAKEAHNASKEDVARKYINIALSREPRNLEILKIKSTIDGI
ncbi:MAG: DUF4034 domain-containing protein [Cyanobacteria bacterium P01_F01_bin.42]